MAHSVGAEYPPAFHTKLCASCASCGQRGHPQAVSPNPLVRRAVIPREFHLDDFALIQSIKQALHRAGVPKDAIILLHLSHEITMQAEQSALMSFVSLTGSVVGHRAVEQAAVNGPRFKGVAPEV